jgi:hypothetical protein
MPLYFPVLPSFIYFKFEEAKFVCGIAVVVAKSSQFVARPRVIAKHHQLPEVRNNLSDNLHDQARKISGNFPADLYKLLFLTKHPFQMAHTTSNPKIHEGRNLKRFRELLSAPVKAI